MAVATWRPRSISSSGSAHTGACGFPGRAVRFARLLLSWLMGGAGALMVTLLAIALACLAVALELFGADGSAWLVFLFGLAATACLAALSLLALRVGDRRYARACAMEFVEPVSVEDLLPRRRCCSAWPQAPPLSERCCGRPLWIKPGPRGVLKPREQV